MSVDSCKNEERILSDVCKDVLSEKIGLQNDIELRQKELLTELFILFSVQENFPDVKGDIYHKIYESEELKMFLAQNSLKNGLTFDESTLEKYIFSQENLATPLKNSESFETSHTHSVNTPLQSEKTTYDFNKTDYKETEEHRESNTVYTNIDPSTYTSDYLFSNKSKHFPNHKQNKTNRADLLSWLIQTSAMPMYKLMQSSNKILVTRDWNTALIETKFIKVLERINKLKENNSWSFRQMIKQKTPSRVKTHWDFMLDEMRWLQADFKEERKWKIVLAKQIITWVMEWYASKVESSVNIQSNSVESHISLSENEKYDIIDSNGSFCLSKNETDTQQNIFSQNKNNENRDSSFMGFDVKKDSSENNVMLHSSPVFIIENALQLLDIPPNKIIATFSNVSQASNTILPDLPLYQPPVPEDTLYHDPLDEMKIIPLSKYTQSHIKISHSDNFFKKRKREASPIDSDDISNRQKTIVCEFSLANSQTLNSRKKSIYPSQLRPPNIPLNLENRKPLWSSDEDDFLMTYLPKYQFNWEFVAQTLTPSMKWISPTEKKTAWDCFERWAQLDPHASNVVFIGPHAKTAYARLEPILKNKRTNSYGDVFRSKKDTGKNLQNLKLKRQRQFNMFDAIRKTMKKREISQKLNVGLSKKVNILNHDAHGMPHKSSAAAPTPLDLSRLKHERDQVITQAYIRQRNAVVALALQNQARSSGRSNLPGINPTAQQMAQIQSVHAQLNAQNRIQGVSRAIPGMVNGLRFTRSVCPSIPGQPSPNPASITPILRLPPGARLSQEQMQQLILQRQQLLQAQRTQAQTIQQTAHYSDTEQNEIPSESKHLVPLNQHQTQPTIQNHNSNSLTTECTHPHQQSYSPIP